MAGHQVDVEESSGRGIERAFGQFGTRLLHGTIFPGVQACASLVYVAI